MNNDWHKRGELPPVGGKCEVFNGKDWLPAKFIGTDPDGLGSIFKTMEGYRTYTKVRPLRTEHDKLVERGFSDIGRLANDDDAYVIDRLIAENWRPIKEQSEEEFIHESLKIRDVCTVLQLPLRVLYRAGCRFVDVGVNND